MKRQALCIILALLCVGAGTSQGSNTYHFSRDWFTHNIPLWEKILAPFKEKPNLHYLEIGVFEGRSAIWMLENILTHPTSRLTGIDIFPKDLQERFLANLKISGFSDKVTVIKGFSQVELRKLPLHSYDIIYIDGSHAARDVLTDAVLSWDLLKVGGLLIFDDYDWTEPVSLEFLPRLSINAFVMIFGAEADIIHKGYQMVLQKKEKPQKRLLKNNYLFALRFIKYYQRESALIFLSFIGLLLITVKMTLLISGRRGS